MSLEATTVSVPTPQERFERCLTSLQRLVEERGLPLDAISDHPAVRATRREMLSLLMHIEDPLAFADDEKYSMRPPAQIIDLSEARARRR